MNGLQITVENFAAIKDDPIKLLERIPFSDNWFDCIWTLTSHLQEDSLSIKVQCDPCIDSDSTWYCFVEMKLNFRQSIPGPPFERKSSMLLSKTEPNLVFSGIENLNVILDPKKGFIHESGEVIIHFEILNYRLYKCVPVKALPSTYWNVRDSSISASINRHFTRHFFNRPQLSDCTVTGSDGYVFAHKYHLALHNDFFENQFYTLKKDSVDFGHVSRRTILMLLAFIYRHEFIIDSDYIIDLHELALQVGIEDLAKLCRLHLTPYVVAQILGPQSSSYSEQLKTYCREFLVKKKEVLADKEVLQNLERSELELLCAKLSQK